MEFWDWLDAAKLRLGCAFRFSRTVFKAERAQLVLAEMLRNASLPCEASQTYLWLLERSPSGGSWKLKVWLFKEAR